MIKYFFLSVLFMSAQAETTLQIVNNYPGAQYLPENFQIYVHNGSPSTTPTPGDTSIHLPVENDYKINPGCYIACYQANRGAFEMSPSVYEVGLVRIPGQYINEQCFPHNYFAKADVSENKLISVCNKLFPLCDSACWIGLDTAGFFT